MRAAHLRPVTLLLLACAVPSLVSAQATPRQEFEKLRTRTLAEAAQRHLRVGSWARKAGLVQQATAQFLRAEEVGEGTNPGASTVVGMMRSLDDAFWRENLAKPSRARVRNFEVRAADCEEQNRRDWLLLALTAHRRGLPDDALTYLRKTLDAVDEPPTWNDDGSLRIGKLGKVPAELAARLVDQDQAHDAVATVLGGVIAVGTVHRAASPELIVETDIDQARADRTHALLSKLLPHLEAVTGERPRRALRVFVFAERATFLAWLDARGYPASDANGLCDYATYVATVCAEGLMPALVDAVAIHETTHLWDAALSPVVFPSWYVEAFAESFGAPGTFSVDEAGALTVGGPIPDFRLASLREPDGYLPLADLLRIRGTTLLQTDREKALRFYAEALAFLRYLRDHADADVRERFVVWEARCRGTGVGAAAGSRVRDESAAQALFDATLGPDLARIETGFRAWLGIEDAPRPNDR